jgi:phytoene synthase
MTINVDDGASREDAKEASYIAGEVRRHDRDRFLTTLFAPAECRDHLWTLFAVNAEIARIRDGVSEPMLGHVKVQWWRDVIAVVAEKRGAPTGHPIAQGLERVMGSRRLTGAWLEEILAARDWELDDGAFPTLAALEEHGERTAVRLAWLGLETLGVTDAVSRDAVRHAAIAYALCGSLRTVPFHAARNRLLLPRDLLDRAGITLGGIQAGRDMDALAAVTAEVAVRARVHLDLARSLSRMADRRSATVLLWATIADSYLRALAGAAHNVFDRRMLAFRPGVLRLIWAAWRRHY